MNLNITKKTHFCLLPINVLLNIFFMQKKKKEIVLTTSSFLTTEVSVMTKKQLKLAIASKGNKLYGVLSISNGRRLKTLLTVVMPNWSAGRQLRMGHQDFRAAVPNLGYAYPRGT